MYIITSMNNYPGIVFVQILNMIVTDYHHYEYCTIKSTGLKLDIDVFII